MGTAVVGCTVVAGNYLPYARVLAQAWRRLHGDAPFVALVVDRDADGGTEEPFAIVSPAGLGLDRAEIDRLRGIYGVVELTTALKAPLIRHLLDAGAEAVIYMDSDTGLYADLSDVAELAATHGLVLSPHVIEPFPSDGLCPSEIEFQRWGTFNSGFVAAGQAGRPFLEWWSGRLRRDCLLSEGVGFHADQRWLEWAPVYSPCLVLRDPTVNVGHWNLHERPVRLVDGAPYVDGRAVRTIHFSGYDPERPHELTRHRWPRPLRVAIDAPDIQTLSRRYGEALVASGYREHRGAPYPFGHSAAGTPLGTWRRRLYREIVIAAEARGDRDVPSPFDPRRSDEFERMLEDPRSMGLSRAALARIRDCRLVEPVPGGGPSAVARRGANRLRRAMRRVPVPRRHHWMPDPLPSDRVSREYALTRAVPRPAAMAGSSHG